MQEELKQLSARREYFNRHLPKLKGADRRNDIKNLGNSCPSCGYPTLEERCSWEICTICFWEDDGQDDEDADNVFGGPNGDYSLTKHRIEWDEKLNEIKAETSVTGKKLIRIDELIKNDNNSDMIEILELIRIVSNWFDDRRKIKN